MNTVGPIILDKQQSMTYKETVTVAVNGFVEVVNYSNNVIQVAVPTSATTQNIVTQSARSQAIYPIPYVAQGQASPTITLVETLNAPCAAPLLFLNVYQPGEIAWHPPFSLDLGKSGIVLPSFNTIFATSAQGAGNATYELRPAVPSPWRQAMTGFDFTIQPTSSGTAQGTLVVNGIDAEEGQTTLNYQSWANPSRGNHLGIRFPDPVFSLPGQALSITVPPLPNTFACLTMYGYIF